MIRILLLICLVFSSTLEARKERPKIKREKKPEVTAQSIAMPLGDEACFSPDEKCDLKLVRLILSAEKSIDVAVYDINLDQVVHHLLVKSKTIPVRIVLDKRQASTNHSLASTLIKAGSAQVRYGKQRGIMHNKFIIVDGKTLMMGSFNFTYGAADKNQENQLYLTNAKIIEQYQKRFDKIWEKGNPVP